MFYNSIPKVKDRKRIADRLLALKDAMEGSEGIPVKSDDMLLLATWNIREFDSAAYGERGAEPLYYIAEILSHFDLIAIQEVREDLKALENVRKKMGGWWKYIATDVTEGTQGNRERMAFLYDCRKVRFGNVAGEVVIPPVEKKSKGKKTTYNPSKQLFRTPFLCGFKSGWARFMLCTVHILFGKDKRNDPNRIEEIKQIADFLAKRSEEETTWSKNIILIGDFNIYDPNDITMKQILDAGFIVPKELQKVPHTNTGSKNRHYDQIAFRPRTKILKDTGKAGVFDFFNIVYRNEDEEKYIETMGDAYFKTSKGKKRNKAQKTNYYKTYWRTHQMSDHLPMWIQLRTDFGRDYLQGMI
jgi:exonuclease III